MNPKQRHQQEKTPKKSCLGNFVLFSEYLRLKRNTEIPQLLERGLTSSDGEMSCLEVKADIFFLLFPPVYKFISLLEN